ncbi:DUF2723 domain-containing protein [Moheibacter stercoris]|uniref:DUF2723 domain-containing protein n=1 Tax=Moheibacter stercoris TaxID=1628251 RepID=A0ABV2LQM3_9FLAO
MNIPFKKWNNILGWGMFVISAIVYLLTMERKLSFWDCGEYIVSSAKLGVTHAPGAALYQLIGAVWAGLAFGDTSKYAVLINSMSAIASAATIMFLFWTITHLARRMFFVTKPNELIDNAYSTALSKSQALIVLGSGIVGSMAFMFSDSFWFSAVEGEVYAMASLFTAILIWMGCKWEEESDKDRANKWFLLISLFIGLATGVHLMAILAIPAVCYMYYAKNYKFTVKSFIIANIITAVFLGFVFKVLFGAIMSFFGKTEIYVVNNFGLPFNSGTFIAALILILVFWLGVKYTKKYNWKLGNTMVLSIAFMLIGFSCWLVIPIRANANPHMNLNDPDSALGMLDYFNREQYGDWPTIRGQVYTAHIADDGISVLPSGAYETKVTGANYVKDLNSKKYIKVSDRKDYVYNKKHIKWFPKMYNASPDVMENYAAMYGFPEFSINPMFFNNPEDHPEVKAQKRQYAEKMYNDLLQKKHDGSLKVADLQKASELLDIQPPTFGQQLNYFLDFQLDYMFFRYFMWNFSGKQNDWEGNLEVTKGNWITGIPFIDNARLGDQSKLPAVFKENKGHNVYYMLPLILGLIGFFVQLNRNLTHWWAILSLFLLTSVGIIFYTSVKPFEPRERDYALVSSFYAFAIWIGLGVQAIYLLVKKFKKRELTPSVSIVISAICLGIPLLMGFQNWDDHDRSKREGAYALAYNYLKNLDKNAILFVYGDNDTYPLWGLQETENFRDDLKIVNYTLLGSPWNIEQSLRRTYNAAPLPGKMQYKDYQLNTNDNIMVVAGSIKSIFNELHSIIRPDASLSLSEIMNLSPDQISGYLTDPGYDPAGIQNMYRSVQSLEQYLVKDSMTVKEAMDFLMDNKNPSKAALADYFGYPVGAVNYLPVDKLVIPVNKENAIKHGIVSAADAGSIVDHITIKLGKRQLYKSELMMISMFSEYNWDRSIYFSGGGISDGSNIFWLSDYLENNGFTYKLIPIKTPFGSGGKLGRTNTEQMYKNFQEFEWANYNLDNASFSNTDRNYTNTYRNIGTRLAEDFIERGDKATAKKILDTLMEKIPDQPRYDYGVSLERVGHAYRKIGETEKANKILKSTKDRLIEKINFYETLPSHLRYTVGKQLADARSDYAIMVYGEVTALLQAGNKEGAMKVFESEFKPIKEKLVQTYKAHNKDGNIDVKEQNNIDGQFRFVSELLGIADMIDSTYAERETNNLYDILTNEK